MRAPSSRDVAAALLAGGAASGLLVGALIFQYGAGLPPCEMCIWQRWPHGIAVFMGLAGGVAVLLGALPSSWARPLALLTVAAILTSGALGVYHAGVEWKWWPGPDACTGGVYLPGASPSEVFAIVRCDEAPWRLLGLSLAGYNALFSFGAATWAIAIMKRRTAGG